MTGVGVVAPFLSPFAKSLGAGPLEAGIVFGGFGLARGLVAPLAGSLSDRFGRKAFIVAGLLASALFTWSYSLATTAWALIAFRVAHGAASSFTVPLKFAYVGDMAPEGVEGRYVSGITIAIMCGFGSGPVLGGILSERLGVLPTFALAAAALAATGLAVAWLLPAGRARNRSAPSVRGVLGLVRHREVRGLMLIRFLNAFGLAGMMAYLSLVHAHFTGRAEDLDFMHIGFVLSAQLLVATSLQYPGGWLADRLPGHRLAFIVGGNLFVSAALWSVNLGTTAAGYWPCILLFGLGRGLSTPATGAWTAVLGRRVGMGALVGLFNLALSLGIAAGPVTAGAIGGLAGDAWSFPGLAILSAAFTGVAGAVLLGRSPAAAGRGDAATRR